MSLHGRERLLLGDDAAVPRLRDLVLVLIVAVMVLIPRAVLITRVHTDYWDDQYHLMRGLAFLRGELLELKYNDPPLGEALTALPLLVTGCKTNVPPRVGRGIAPVEDESGQGARYNVLHNQPVKYETLLTLVAVWKSVLFLPACLVAFCWATRLYGRPAGWMATVLLLFDPTVAAHVVTGAVDSLGMTGVVVACYAAWRCFAEPGRRSLVFAAAALATALLLKHTALVVPVVVFAMAMLEGWRRRQYRAPFNRALAVCLLAVPMIWVLTGFNYEMPKRYTEILPASYEATWGFTTDVLNPILERKWPGGVYVGTLFEGWAHGRGGHASWLWGEESSRGWWWYLPAVAMYKVPFATWGIGVMAMLSLAWLKWRERETPLLLAIVLVGGYLLASRLSIGFRHALPVCGLMLILLSRVADVRSPRGVAVLAWVLVAVGAVRTTLAHPEYLSFTNIPSVDTYRSISDSNVDWGQGVRQVRDWLDASPVAKGRAVNLLLFGDPRSRTPGYFLGTRVRQLNGFEPDIPRSGLLVISVVHLTGQYDERKSYRFLMDVEPVARIGPGLLVFDLDALAAAGLLPNRPTATRQATAPGGTGTIK